MRLVNARHVKKVPGRKSDVLDCQWLHSYGLLEGAFRPTEQVCTLRAYVRQRMNLVRYASARIQHMQKALSQINLQLANVVSDISEVTGMRIIKAVLAGERDPLVLARLRDSRCKNDESTIARSLQGNFRPEHLFSLKQAVDLYEYYQGQIVECDRQILGQLASFDAADGPVNGPPVNLQEALMRMSGVGSDSYRRHRHQQRVEDHLRDRSRHEPLEVAQAFCLVVGAVPWHQDQRRQNAQRPE